MRRLLCTGILLTLCCGCATTTVRDTPGNIAMTEALLANVKGTVVQSVSGAWKDEAFTAECVLKGDGKKFTAILLAPHMRLATLTIDRPHTIRWKRSPRIPRSLDPEYVIFDLALINLTTEQLMKALGKDFKVDETPDGKRRGVIDAERGELHSVRQILPDGNVYFRNARYGYEFMVKTVPNEN